MNPLLHDTAVRLGDSPRPAFDLRLGPTMGLADDDPIGQAAADAKLLTRHGELTFGVVVFTLGDVAKSDRLTVPAIVVHAPPRGIQIPLVDLVDVGSTLWAQRSQNDPSLADFTRFLGDTARPARHPVPPRLTLGARLEITRVAVSTRLPGRRLAATFLPLLVHEKSKTAAVLPPSLWAPNLASTFLRWAEG